MEKAIDNIGDMVLIDTQAAARILGLAPVTLQLMRVEKRGPAYYKIGKAVRYAIEDLNAYATRVEA